MYTNTCIHTNVACWLPSLYLVPISLTFVGWGCIPFPSRRRPMGYFFQIAPSPLYSPPYLRRATVFANGSLLLTQVRPRNAGVYRCIGQGQRGPPVILEAMLHLAGGSWCLGCRSWGFLPCQNNLEGRGRLRMLGCKEEMLRVIWEGLCWKGPKLAVGEH